MRGSGKKVGKFDAVAAAAKRVDDLSECEVLAARPPEEDERG